MTDEPPHDQAADAATQARHDAQHAHTATNHRHLVWASVVFFVMMTFAGYSAVDVAPGAHPLVRVLTAMLIAAAVTACFAALGWLMIRGSAWAFELPFRVQQWWRQRR